MIRQLAEGVGFEPTRGSAPTRSPGVRLRPLGHPSERARPYKGPILEATVTAAYGATGAANEARQSIAGAYLARRGRGARASAYLARHGNTRSDGHPPSGLDGGCPRIPAGESLELQHSKPEADASPTVPAAGQPAAGWHRLLQLARTWIRLVCAGPALGRNRRSTPFLQLASMRSASISSDSVNERS